MTIDELIVKLSLDAAGLKQGAKDAQAAATKLAAGLVQSAEQGEKGQAASHKRTAASAMAMGKSIVDSNQKVTQSFEGILRTGLAFLAMFTGAKSIEDFTRRMVALDASVGRMAHNVGSTPERVSALAMAVARSGGTFEGATSAVQGLSDAYQELITTGTNGIMEPLSRLQALGGHSITVGNDWHKTLDQIADDLKVIDKTNPQLANSLGLKALGDQGLVNLAKGGSEAIHAAEEQSKKHGLITQEQVEAAQKAQAAWADLNQSVTSFGNTLVTDLEPDITKILGAMDDWIDANKGWVADDIKADIETFGQTLKDHKEDIKRFGDELLTVVGVAGKIAVAFAAQGPAAQALEVFAALIGTKILGPLTLARAALGLGLLTPAAIAAGASADSTPDADTQKKQDQYYKDHPEANRTVFGAIADWWTGKTTGPQESRTKDDRYDPVADHNRDATAAANERLGQGKGFLTDVLNYAKQKLGFGEGDSRTKDDISTTAAATTKTADLLKAQQDAATVSNASPVTVSSGGLGGSGQHFGGGTSPGASLSDKGHGGHGHGGGVGGAADPNLPAGNVPGASGYGAINAYWRGQLDKRGEGGHTGPKEMFDYLKSQGASDNEALLLTGAASSESSFNPNAVHDGGTGHGLFGHKDSRLDMRGKDWQQQSVLALAEARQMLGKRINEAKTPEELADLEMHYERPRGYSRNNPRAGDNYMGRLNSIRRFSALAGQPTAAAPSPAGTSAKAITDAEAFAAHQRIVNGSRDAKDKSLYDLYLQQQNAPKHHQSIHDALDILRDARKLTHHGGQPIKVSLDRGSVEHMAMLSAAQRSALGRGSNVSTVDRRSTSETNIAELHVHSQARDAASIARDTHAALIARREAADKGNYGLA